jgi:Methylamine utilisation protein MauE
MTVAEAVGGACAFLALLLALSLVGKVASWRKGERAALLAAVPGPARLRPRVLLVALLAEGLVAATLILAPRLGAGAASVLFLVYTVHVAAIPDGTPCNCFGNAFEFGQRRLLRVLRNAFLLLVALAALLGAARLPVSPMAFLGGAVAVLTAFVLDLLVSTTGHEARTGAVRQ